MKISNDKINFYEKNLERINYWLQFAEAKNAAIIAFAISILVVIWTSKLSDNIYIATIISFFYLISLIISLCSFYPKGKNLNINEKIEEYNSNDNFLFWNDIAKYSAKDYIEGINKQVQFENDDISAMEKMYVEEIISNARIAKIKYKKFKYSVVISIIGTFVIFIALVLA
ncbi:MAG: Pycsar system effector family protein [Catonella sp.]|uniref:Pycsar system effector family protein n=1 Tax=Catonella sp. TaxID=2382125 RepID=UPI003FA00643